MTSILGISAFYHDSAAALVIDGKVVAAAQEERFSRKKNDEAFPVRAIEYCLREAGMKTEELDYVSFYDKPLLKFERLLETYLAFAPQGFGSFLKAMPKWLNQKLWLPREMSKGLGNAYKKQYIFSTHHESHAASAFFPSPFDEAAILTLDGVGEWATASYGVGRQNRISLTHELHFPHSVGLLYSAFTYYTGFKVNEGEYKLMGLAPYGQPNYVGLIMENILDLKEDGSLRLDLSYFNYCTGLTMTSEKFHRLFGGPPRAPDGQVTERFMDIAASIQQVTEEIMLRAARHVHKQTGLKNLCLAGGVALNCVGNGRVLRDGPFENIWIQPAAGDAGGALGTALFVWHQLLNNPRSPSPGDTAQGALLGPTFTDQEIQVFLDRVGASYTRIEDDLGLCDHVAGLLAESKVLGWFQGRMEFGPRALGARSILGDARRADMQSLINLKVKFREGFRPFAPSVLLEHAGEYFDFDEKNESPYMLFVCPVKNEKRLPLTTEESKARGMDLLKLKRSEIPAVTHVDYSARLQTVDRVRHGLYRTLLEAFYKKTGCPVLINTSFNMGWEPIVCTPEEAYATFMSSDIDALCLGHFVLRKEDQRAWVNITDSPIDRVLAPLLKSPCSDEELVREGERLVCAATGKSFEVDDGVPLLFVHREGKGGASVESLHEETPLPSYEGHDSVRSLIEKAARGGYEKQLYQEMPFNSTILEVGCGTGQLSNFLGISCRRVIGTDACRDSLRLANGFRKEQGLHRVSFVQMNLFRPCFKPEQFDVVLCNGVLHHSNDPRAGFKALAPLVKPGGHILVGLYNTYASLAMELRRSVFSLDGGQGRDADPQAQDSASKRRRQAAWIADRYTHPHESGSPVVEVLEWFKAEGLELVRGRPTAPPESGGGRLLDPTPPGGMLDHFLYQFEQVLAGTGEGGFFVMIGKKPEASRG